MLLNIAINFTSYTKITLYLVEQYPLTGTKNQETIRELLIILLHVSLGENDITTGIRDAEILIRYTFPLLGLIKSDLLAC